MANKPNLEKMVNLNYLAPYFKNKKVLVSGHTGFKGSWLIQILHSLGAKIYGYALAPEHDDDLYNQINGPALCELSVFADIRNAKKINAFVKKVKPDFIFHLAAQPLVIDSYKRPLYTYEVNGMGTAYLLESVKQLKRKCVVVNITTDKVYENKEQGLAFTESDKLGGYDPYSASKAVSEIIIASYRDSFFNPADFGNHKKAISSARAGNVIGGGDYAENRLVPDIVKALNSNETIVLRNPNSVRPWQHVLEPLGGYLLLACKLHDKPTKYAQAYNFGPETHDVLTVEQLCQQAIAISKKGKYEVDQQSEKLHEAHLLQLDISKAKKELGWQPKLTAAESIRWTVDWYLNPADAKQKCAQQIEQYFNA